MADPTLYLYTSLTAGSSHIITATSRLETILKANKIPFRALDCATDEKARTLWSRRSRGRKLPGLVKFGQVVGDLDQIEEWNEFGELHDQIDSADDFLDASAAAPPNPNSITLRPEPGPGVANQLTPVQPAATGTKKDQRAPSGTSSRASSETRHISISEPTAQEREGRSPLATPSDNPMTMTMRQLGAEAAAKAKDNQRKPSGTASNAPRAVTSVVPDQQTPQPPSPATAKEREVADPRQEPEVTAAKMPAQLAAEGARRTSVDKIDAEKPSPSAVLSPDTPAASRTDSKENETAAGSPAKSTEEQLLDLRRQSTQTNVPSRLSDSVSAEPDTEPIEEVKPTKEDITTSTDLAKDGSDVEPPVTEALNEPDPDTDPVSALEERPATGKPLTSAISSTQPVIGPNIGLSHTSESSAPLAALSSTDIISPAGSKPRSHRGSSVEEVDKDEIKRIEQSIKIDEDPEEHETAVDTTEDSISKKLLDQKDEKPQDTEAKDPEATTKSVGD